MSLQKPKWSSPVWVQEVEPNYHSKCQSSGRSGGWGRGGQYRFLGKTENQASVYGDWLAAPPVALAFGKIWIFATCAAQKPGGILGRAMKLARLTEVPKQARTRWSHEGEKRKSIYQEVLHNKSTNLWLVTHL